MCKRDVFCLIASLASVNQENLHIVCCSGALALFFSSCLIFTEASEAKAYKHHLLLHN